MPDFKNQHLSKMTDPTRLQKERLERGMVAKINYIKASGEKGEYFVFVLQPRFKEYFHCVDLDKVSPIVFSKLAAAYPEIMAESTRVRKLDLTKLRIDEASKAFYMGEIRNRKLQDGYRTLIYKNIGNVVVYNYNYGVNDKIKPQATRRQEEQVQKDDTTL
jgi:hypothetical protein